MWAIVGWTALSVVVGAIVVYSLAVVVAFLVDRFVVAGDPSSTVVVSGVSVFQVERTQDAAWEYYPVHLVEHSPKKGSQKYSAAFNKRSRKAYLVDPGVLARRNQFEPMFPVIERDYDIFTLEYGGLCYDREWSAAQIAGFAYKLLSEYDEVVYNGISHGGMHALYVSEWLKPLGKKFSRVILHDAPYGVDTLKTLPNFAVSLFKFTAGSAANVVCWPMIKAVTTALPKKENVTLPSRENLQMLLGRTDVSPDEYFEWVKRSAKRNLSGHKFSMFYSETADMIAAGNEQFPQGVFDGVPVAYIQYVEKNDTVVQPAASDIYRKGIDNLHVLDVVGTHAGFTENYDDNVEALYQALVFK